MSERELVHQLKRRATKDRNLAAGLQRTTATQFVELLAARRVCTPMARSLNCDSSDAKEKGF